MLRRMLDSLELSLVPSPPPTSQLSSLISNDQRIGRGSYRPLLSRPTSATFEERYESYQENRRKRKTQDQDPA